MLQVTFDIEGVRELSRSIQKIADEVKEWSPAFREVSDYMYDAFAKEVFSSEGMSVGEPWKPLSPEYAAWKARHYPGKGILVRTGKMQKSFRQQSGKDFAMIDNPSIPYFVYHQSRFISRDKLPRRVMLRLGESQKTTIIRIFHTYWYQKTRV